MSAINFFLPTQSKSFASCAQAAADDDFELISDGEVSRMRAIENLPMDEWREVNARALEVRALERKLANIVDPAQRTEARQIIRIKAVTGLAVLEVGIVKAQNQAMSQGLHKPSEDESKG